MSDNYMITVAVDNQDTSFASVGNDRSYAEKKYRRAVQNFKERDGHRTVSLIRVHTDPRRVEIIHEAVVGKVA